MLENINGYKTWIGLVLWGAGSIVELFVPGVGTVMRVIGEGLITLGAGHKILKQSKGVS